MKNYPKMGDRPGAWRRSGVFIVNFEHILHLLLMFLLLTLSKKCWLGNCYELKLLRDCSNHKFNLSISQ